MDVNHFRNIYQSLSTKELEEIIHSASGYVISARMAAIEVLTSRDINHHSKDSIEKEYLLSQKQIDSSKKKERFKNVKLIKSLSSIPIGNIMKFPINNSLWIEIKRSNNSKYVIRQNDNWQGWMAPILIINVASESKMTSYPFFNYRTILTSLFFGICFLFYGIYDKVDKESLYILFGMPILMLVSIQILLLPIMYYKLLDKLQERFDI